MCLTGSYTSGPPELFLFGKLCSKFTGEHPCRSAISTKLQTKPTTQKMKFSIEYFFSKCDQIRSFLRIWSHLLKKSLMEDLIFCAVYIEITLRHGCSTVNLLHIFRKPFPKNTSGGLVFLNQITWNINKIKIKSTT